MLLPLEKLNFYFELKPSSHILHFSLKILGQKRIFLWTFFDEFLDKTSNMSHKLV